MSDTDSPTPGETYVCPECNRQVTVGQSGVEYGHERAQSKTKHRDRCSRRPDRVDPGREGEFAWERDHDNDSEGDDV